MCWMNITCPKCAMESSLEAMTERPVSGILPPGQFQCPICGYAFQRRETTPGHFRQRHQYEYVNDAPVRILRTLEPEYIPGKLGLIPCAGVL